jgi:hypothetical protein
MGKISSTPHLKQLLTQTQLTFIINKLHQKARNRLYINIIE